jgi:hypothetical protein
MEIEGETIKLEFEQDIIYDEETIPFELKMEEHSDNEHFDEDEDVMIPEIVAECNMDIGFDINYDIPLIRKSKIRILEKTGTIKRQNEMFDGVDNLFSLEPDTIKCSMYFIKHPNEGRRVVERFVVFATKIVTYKTYTIVVKTYLMKLNLLYTLFEFEFVNNLNNIFAHICKKYLDNMTMNIYEFTEKLCPSCVKISKNMKHEHKNILIDVLEQGIQCITNDYISSDKKITIEIFDKIKECITGLFSRSFKTKDYDEVTRMSKIINVVLSPLLLERSIFNIDETLGLYELNELQNIYVDILTTIAGESPCKTFIVDTISSSCNKIISKYDSDSNLDQYMMFFDDIKLILVNFELMKRLHPDNDSEPYFEILSNIITENTLGNIERVLFMKFISNDNSCDIVSILSMMKKYCKGWTMLQNKIILIGNDFIQKCSLTPIFVKTIYTITDNDSNSSLLSLFYNVRSNYNIEKKLQTMNTKLRFKLLKMTPNDESYLVKLNQFVLHDDFTEHYMNAYELQNNENSSSMFCLNYSNRHIYIANSYTTLALDGFTVSLNVIQASVLKTIRDKKSTTFEYICSVHNPFNIDEIRQYITDTLIMMDNKKLVKNNGSEIKSCKLTTDINMQKLKHIGKNKKSSKKSEENIYSECIGKIFMSQPTKNISMTEIMFRLKKNKEHGSISLTNRDIVSKELDKMLNKTIISSSEGLYKLCSNA